jgi:membrane AbrB-like protein
LLHTLGRLLHRLPTQPADQLAVPHVGGGGRVWAWLVLIVVGFLTGVGGQAVQVPAPYLLAALVVGAAAALSGLLSTAFPRPAYRASQAMVGVLMGSYLDPTALRVGARSILPLTAVTLATVVLSVGVAFLFFRSSLINRATATLGMVPGGSPAVIAAAEDLGADSRLVALAQYFRVAVIAVTAPLIVSFLSPFAFSHGPSIVPVLMAWRPVSGTHQAAGLVTLGAVVLLGTWAGTRLSLPAPFVLGPMLVTAVAIFTGAANGFAPAGPLQNLAFTCVGLEIGLRFSRESLQHARRHIARLIAGTLTVIVVCFLLAWPLATFAHLPFSDAYLATSPGGINAILATSVATHANVALISSVQSLRLSVVVLATPFIRWILVRTSEPGLPRTAKPRPHPAGAPPQQRRMQTPHRTPYNGSVATSATPGAGNRIGGGAMGGSDCRPQEPPPPTAWCNRRYNGCVPDDRGTGPGEWVLLSYRMPREPSTPRIAVWRKLKRLGIAQLSDGLVALPADARTREQLEWTPMK